MNGDIYVNTVRRRRELEECVLNIARRSKKCARKAVAHIKKRLVILERSL